ncbi:MAG: PAS domain S-box protein [Planctomycetes bacterium]|nr:PAS domain S-box protein [Planctomycetota bacterium]
MRRKTLYILLAIAMLSVIALLVYGSRIAFSENAQYKAQSELLSRMSIEINKIKEGEKRAAIALGESPQIINILRNENTRKYMTEAKVALEAVRSSLGASIAYVLSKDGTVVAAVQESGASIVGNNYAFRPYFTKAMKGDITIYPAKGVTTKLRGVYASAPVINPDDKTVMGVVVVKSSPRSWDRVLEASSDPVIIVSPDGVIFASNVRKLILKTTPEVNEEKRLTLKKSRQFGDSELEPAQWVNLSSDVSFGDIRYHTLCRELSSDKWRIASFTPMDTNYPLESTARLTIACIASTLLLMSGTVLFLLINIHKRHDAELELKHMNENLAREVTARTDELTRQADSLRKLSTAVEQSPSIVVITDPKGNIEYVNPRFTELTGYSAKEVIGKNPRILKSGGTPEENYKKLWDTITSGRVWTGEFQNKRKNGTLYYELTTIGPIKNDAGEITHFLAVKEDATQRKDTEKEVRLLAKFPDESPFPTLRITPDGSVVYSNNASKTLLKAMDINENNELSESWREFSLSAFDSDKPVAKEVIAGDRIFALSFVPIKEFFYINIYAHDITERVAMEREIKKNNNALVRLNQQLKLNQQQLIQSEKMASIGQLAAGIAHEINNPIGFVMSNISTLCDYIRVFKELIAVTGKIEDAVAAGNSALLKEALKEIARIKEDEDIDYLMNDSETLLTETRDGTERVKDIVQNLKSFARLDESEVKEADINEGIEASLKIAWNEMKYKCTVTKNLNPLPRLRCYPGQLNQVFMNMFVNAAHAIEEKGEVTVTTEATDDNIVVTISDNGKGIKEEDIPRLFDPFFTTKEVGKGTGLGLSIAHGIIRKHDGDIQVESKVGAGTTFRIILPIKGVSDG